MMFSEEMEFDPRYRLEMARGEYIRTIQNANTLQVELRDLVEHQELERMAEVYTMKVIRDGTISQEFIQSYLECYSRFLTEANKRIIPRNAIFKSRRAEPENFSREVK